MTEIIRLEKYELDIIPDTLTRDFEEIIFEAYFEGHFHDLHQLADHTDYFIIYSYSYKETGDPFDWEDDDSRECQNEMLIRKEYPYLMRDIHTILNHYHIFHAWRDFGEYGQRDYQGLFNEPFLNIW